MRTLIEQTFEDMREDYSLGHTHNFDHYKSAFKTVSYIAQNLFEEKKPKKEEEND